MVSNKYLSNIANILRRDSIIATTTAGSGHPSSCMSCAEIMSVLFFETLNHDKDEFILSKGHAAPILYSALYRKGLLDHHPYSLRKLKSPLQGHPVPSEHIKNVKVATGSLGQGLSIGVGMALAGKLKKSKYKTFVLLGDSEITEGSVYEALILASYYKLNNLTAIVDINKLGQRGPTMFEHNIKKHIKIFQALGWNTIAINGHKISHLKKYLKKTVSKPTAILARTIKGKGFKEIENKNSWHGKPLSIELMHKALKEIPNPRIKPLEFKKYKNKQTINKIKKPNFTTYILKEKIATRFAYGNAIANLAHKNKSILAIDAEVSNSTYSNQVKINNPKQFIESFIAEQNMIGMALGLSKKGFNVFASTFSAFLSRAHDQIRMAALSEPNFTIVGSHAGISIGSDGSSQMGLEDLALFRSIPNSIIFYPSDSVSTEKLTYLASKTNGLKYIRTTRSKTNTIYKKNEKFNLGDFKIHNESRKDKVVLIGAGITLHESIEAHINLKKESINTAVVDLYCIKPLKEKKLVNFILRHGGKVVITEDHYPEGGIGEAVLSAIKNTNIKSKHLAVNQIPHSGEKDELLKKEKISSTYIEHAVKSFQH